MAKIIELHKTLFELTNEYPELISILKDLGFMAITNPLVRNTIGRKMTIPNGCEKQKISLDTVVAALEQEGFQVVE